ncbi:MAG: OmpA family protein [Candidatus Hydrogenedentes bacterium]|nr:OmpA family protein [Candidatus Hydrogenedentota bacterium]
MNATRSLLVCAIVSALFLGIAGAAHADKVPVTFKSPQDVSWVHKNRAFGNYLNIERVALPEPAAAASAKADASGPAPAPTFDPILFDLDKSELRPDGIQIAEKVLAYLKANPAKAVTVEGHCCDLASNTYNMTLGQRRADSVKKYLVDRGIEQSRIATKSCGEEQRVTTDEATRHLNRRAIVIVRCAAGQK